MYVNVSYLNNSILDFADTSQPLVVGSCGHYRFFGNEVFHTRRPEGRVDYQLLYVCSGIAHFQVAGEDYALPAGNMVLYVPGEPQDYVYYGEEQPEIFWVHFTGAETEQILSRYGISPGCIFSGNGDVYSHLFQQMIAELKICAEGFEELLAMYLRQILIQVHRNEKSGSIAEASRLRAEMERAMEYFHQHYAEPVSIEAYAHSRSMSVSWFLRCFKQYTKQSPLQYITAIRLNAAVNLLENTDYNIAEIAAMSGYDNPLYFSRIFRKTKGVPPSHYRKTHTAIK